MSSNAFHLDFSTALGSVPHNLQIAERGADERMG